MKHINKYHALFFLFILVGYYAQGQNNPNQQRSIIIDSIFSKTLNEQRQFFVQFPQDYDEKSDKKYPVAIILDGEFLLPTVNNFQGYYSGGFTPEMILVGISNLKNRTRDLTTSTITENYGMPYNRENGEASNFIKFIEDEFIPHIEKIYPVTNYRTLIGHSYGGLFTIYTFLYHLNLFSNYIAIDPSLDWDNQKLVKASQDIIANENYEGKSLFMSLNGQLHMQKPEITIDNVMQDDSDFTSFPRSNIMLKNIIEENEGNGLNFTWKFYPRDLHGTIQFPSIMDGLISIFQWFQMENTQKFNSFETSTEELQAIIKNRADKLYKNFGYQVPPYPEDLLIVLGDMSTDMKKNKKAKMFYEFAVEYYPLSARAHTSMAEYYENNNDFKSSLEYAQKAFSLDSNNYLKKKIERLKGY
ncbi:alpha/beta hydrolase-fold protein [Winogradskyella sp.]|uniref:alpha/beta hydrolase-fold protein n=1 Tax=Winogradskyella sp. TaxID=1883156 RepID=UPI001B01F659|nr:alpha/beta hydrolase-fold protein [Winogradskyella sp.]MBO6880077.1 esterase [Winogradskyella sp.]